jgi:hypothetical protein
MDHPPNEPIRPDGGDPGSAVDADTEDLMATEASIRSDLARLASVEQEKGSLAPDDPRVDELSDEAVDIAARIHRQTLAERQLSEEIG